MIALAVRGSVQVTLLVVFLQSDNIQHVEAGSVSEVCGSSQTCCLHLTGESTWTDQHRIQNRTTQLVQTEHNPLTPQGRSSGPAGQHLSDPIFTPHFSPPQLCYSEGEPT